MRVNFRKILTSKYFLIPAIALLIYTIAGFFVLPFAIRWYVPKYFKENLQCQAILNKVSINPFLLTFRASGFSLAQPDGSPVVAFDSFSVDYKISGLFRRAAVFRRISLDRPVVNVVFDANGGLNLQRLVPKPSQEPKAEEPPTTTSKPVRMLMESVAIHEGKLTVVDRRQSRPAELKIERFSFDLKNLSTLKEHDGKCSFNATTPEGEKIEWEGDVSLLPPRSKGKLSLSGIRATTLWSFVRDSLNLDLAQGSFNVTTTYEIDAGITPLQIALEGVKIGLSDLSLKLLESEKPFLNLTRVELAAPRIDLGNRTLNVEKILLEGGSVDVHIDSSGRPNLQRIVRESAPKKDNEQQAPPPESVSAPTSGNTPATAPDSPFKVTIDAVDIKDVAVGLEDVSRNNPLKGTISSIGLHLKANIEAGSNGAKVTVSDISSELKAVKAGHAQSADTQFQTEKLTIEGGQCDLSTRTLTVTRVALTNGNVDVIRDRNGQLNWLKLFDTKSGTPGEAESKSTPPSDTGWKFLVKSFEIDSFKSKLSDFQKNPQKPLFDIQGINVRLTEIDGKSPMDFSAGFQTQDKGSVSITGKVDPSAPSVEADVKVAGVVLTPLQPYLEPFITLVLRSAAVSTQGKIRYGLPGKGAKLTYDGNFGIAKLSLTEPKSNETFIGFDNMQIPKLSLKLGPNKLEAPEVVVVKPVGSLKIAEDRTVNLAAIVKEHGNKGKVEPPSKASAKRNDDPFPFKIGNIRVQGGNILFADFSLRPKFQAKIHDFKGIVSGLSSGKDSVARMQFDGKVDQYGMAKIGGVMRLYDFKRSSDIDIVFRNVEMTSLSPYSGKFAGYKIKSGKLSMDLKYKIQEKQLVGENKIVVDNLVLGEKVESPDALNLPLKLAVAVLKDSDGRIDIGLPVTGDLDNPQFSIWPLVWKALVNVLTKVVTAPFKALGGLFGVGETAEFNSVDFEPGSGELMPPEKEKLKKLADALHKRPELTLEVQGRYSPETDGMQFKDLNLRRAVYKRLGIEITGDKDPGPLDLTDSKTRRVLEDAFRERFGKSALSELEQGIKEGKIKPRMPTGQQEQKEKRKKAGRFSRMMNSVKLYKLIPGGKSPEQAAAWAGEIYVRLVESEPVSDESLLRLGGERARAIVQELQTSGGIAADRLSTKDPEGTPEDAEPSAKLTLGAV